MFKNRSSNFIDHVIESIFDAILSIAIKAVNGNYWEQSLFIPFNKKYDSYQISYKDYHSNLTKTMRKNVLEILGNGKLLLVS